MFCKTGAQFYVHKQEDKIEPDVRGTCLKIEIRRDAFTKRRKSKTVSESVKGKQTFMANIFLIYLLLKFLSTFTFYNFLPAFDPLENGNFTGKLIIIISSFSIL